MNKAKTKKSITKRFKITKTGKVLRRPSGQDHLLSKASGNKRRRLRKWVEVPQCEAKVIKRLIKQ